MASSFLRFLDHT